MTLQQFIDKYNGVHIDEDGYYGAQCWDVSARYAREVVGCPSFPTGSGGAEGIYRLFQVPIPQYFDRIANDKNNPNQLPQKGDVIVWDASFSPPWGHTAVVISADASGPTVLEQNGNNPGGVAYIKKRGWTGVSGWLRPKNKGIEEVKPTRQEVLDAFNLFIEIPPTEVQFAYYTARDKRELWSDLLAYNVDQKKLLRQNSASLGDQVAQLQADVLSVNTKLDELVKVNAIKDGEIKRLTDENATLQAKLGDANLSVKQAIKILWQTVLDAVKN